MNRGVNLLYPNQLTATFWLRSLGELELLRDEVPRLRGRRKPLLLLAYLARRDEVRVPRSELAALFWPEADESHARQSLRQAILALREAVGDAVEADEGAVRLTGGVVSLDANQFERDIREERHEEAERRWTGEFAAGAELWVGEELRAWIDGQRATLARRRARLGAVLVSSAEERGDWRSALVHAERWQEALPDDPDAKAALERLDRLAPAHRPSAGDSRALLTPDMVGREKELQILAALWDEVAGGRPGLALVTGEEGTGRSRLLEEFLRLAAARRPGTCVLQSRGYEAEQHRDFLLARHLLVPLATAGGIAAAPPGALQALAATFPEFAERYPAVAAPPPDELPEAAGRVLAEVAAESSVLAAVDDFHLADASSRQLIEALLRRPVPGVLLILSIPAGYPALPAGSVPIRRLSLEPLDREGVEQLLSGMGEFAPENRRELAARLLRETGGNPGLVISTVTLLVDEGLLTLGPDGRWHTAPALPGWRLPLAADLRTRLRRRFDALSPAARRVVQAAAILGGEVPAVLLERVGGIEADGFADALGEVVARRYLRGLPDRPGWYRLAGETIGKVALDGMPPDHRRRLHRAAVRALRPLARNDPTLRGTVREHHRRARRPVGERRRLAAGVALLATAAAALGALVLRHAATAPPPPVVITPVAVAADSLAEAGNALRLLLEETLTGVDGIILAPAGAGPVGRQGDRVLLEETLAASGGRLTVHARTRDAGPGGRQLAAADAAGATEDLPAIAAGIARSLFPGHPVLQRRRFRLESARTHSIPALLEYLQGERQARQFVMDEAAAAYYRALQLDTSFVLAWHQLGRVNAWFGLGDRTRILARAASVRATGLDPTETLLVEGWRLAAEGRADQAERRFDAALAVDRRAAEANIGMAEVLWHSNWARGRDPAESRPYWEAARRADPADWRPHAHLWSAAALAGHLEQAAADLHSWRDRLQSGNPDPFVQLMLALAQQDSVGVSAGIAAFGTASAWQITEAAEAAAVDFARPEVATRLARLLTTPRQTIEIQAFGNELLAELAAARGRWADAETEVRRAALLEPVSAATVEAELLLAPFLPADSDLTARRRAVLQRLQGPPTPVRRTFVFWFDLDRAREGIIRRYLARLLAAETGTRTPDTLPAAPPPPADSTSRMWRVLRQSLAARDAARAGQASPAVDTLVLSWDGVEATEAEFSGFYSRPWDRWLVAELLERRGEPDQAARWYAGIRQPSIVDFAFAAPAEWRAGRALEHTGQLDQAATHYRRFLALWRDADPRFRPMLDSARAALSLIHGNR